MCVIMVADCPKKILALSLKDAWQRNSDGAGILIQTQAGITVFKGLMKFKTLMKTLKTIPESTQTAVHFRMATHGASTEENTHPFQIDQDSYLMHNGVLSSLGKAGKDGFSDSGHLAKILTGVDPRDRIPLMEELGGKYLYADVDGMECIGDFTDKDGVLCSNTYWSSTAIVYSGYTGEKWSAQTQNCRAWRGDDDFWSAEDEAELKMLQNQEDESDTMIGRDSGKWATEMREKGWIEGPRGTWTPGTKSAELPRTLAEEVDEVRQHESVVSNAQTKEEAEAETIELLQSNAIEVAAWPGYDEYD